MAFSRAVLADHVAVGQPLLAGVLRQLEGDEPLAEQRLGQQPGGDVGRDLVEVLGIDRQLDGRALGVGLDLAHLADDDPAHLDVGGLLQLVAGGVGLQRHAWRRR